MSRAWETFLQTVQFRSTAIESGKSSQLESILVSRSPGKIEVCTESCSLRPPYAASNEQEVNVRMKTSGFTDFEFGSADRVKVDTTLARPDHLRIDEKSFHECL